MVLACLSIPKKTLSIAVEHASLLRSAFFPPSACCALLPDLDTDAHAQ